METIKKISIIGQNQFLSKIGYCDSRKRSFNNLQPTETTSFSFLYNTGTILTGEKIVYNTNHCSITSVQVGCLIGDVHIQVSATVFESTC